jgi:hypothetical protein
MTKVQAEEFTHEEDTSGYFWRWTGMLLPATAWAVQLQTLYLTSEIGCFDQNFTWNHIASGSALIFSIVGGIIAWTQWPAGEYEATKEESKPRARKRFMGALGLVLSIFFTTVIVAQWLPTLVGVPCGK